MVLLYSRIIVLFAGEKLLKSVHFWRSYRQNGLIASHALFEVHCPSAKRPRDVVVLMEMDRAESGSCQPLVDYFATILPPVQNCLTTIWPLIEILRLLFQVTVTIQRRPRKKLL